jgi:sulfopropanediol 3-dehydrogenase
MIDALPESNATQARLAWRDLGEVILCSSRKDMLDVCNSYAPEHLHVQATDLPWWLENLSSYGSLFLGLYSPHISFI